MAPAPAARRRPEPPPPLVAIVGPTASGKSELAMALADRMPVEILVADSRQVYRGMDIGTAKPTPDERSRVPHHLLDLAEPDQPFTVADWLVRARPLPAAIVGRGAVPLLVGGTGLYVSALVDGFDLATQPWSPEIRARLAAVLETDGLAPLADQLRRIDPVAAAHTDLRNPRRVLRALERAEAGGAGIAPRADPYPGRLALLGIRRPREVLSARIDDRAMRIFDAGLVEEVRSLLDRGFPATLPPMTGHGYREAARVIAGEWSIEEAVRITALRTRQYAKRQLSWFRRDPRIVWLAADDGPASDPALVERTLDLVRRLLG